MDEPIVFTNLPSREELCHILVSIDPCEKKDRSVKSDFQWQLLKTRLLLYSEKNVIATPAAGMLRYIHLAAKKDYCKSGGLSDVLEKHRLKVESVGILSSEMYEECLMYNLIVKLAPLWNKVEKYFIEGRYFLMQRGALHAIDLNIIIKGDLLMLFASPLRVWLREVSLFDLLPSSNIEETLSKPFYIDLYSEPQWVHVLPSFKRGQLVYVSNRIPKGSTFEDYIELRRHWKNTYGYRLPEYDSSTIYVGISFFNNTDFLYPLECVRRGMHMNNDEYSVVVKFAKAVAFKASFICGNQLKLLNLLELENKPSVTLHNKPKWSESKLAALDSELLNRWLSQSSDSLKMSNKSPDCSLYGQLTQNNEEHGDEEKLSVVPSSSFIVEDDPGKKQEYNDWMINCSQFIYELNSVNQKRSFLKASKWSFNKITKAKLLKSESSSKFIKTESINATSPKENSNTITQENNKTQMNSLKPCFNKIVKCNAVVKDISSEGFGPACSDTTAEICNVPRLQSDGEETFSKNDLTKKNVTMLRPVFKIKHKQSPKSVTEPMKAAHYGINLQFDAQESLMSDSLTNRKIRKKSDESLFQSKKRKESNVISLEEIERLVSQNQLEKANVPSLCAYLKYKGVPFSKDKKDVLVEKVMKTVLMQQY